MRSTAVPRDRSNPTTGLMISSWLRCSPLSVTQVDTLSRPLTTTRSPLCSEVATFSASARQQLTPNHMVSPSFQTSVSLSSRRGVEAMRKSVTTAPLASTRVRGSAPTLPVTVMWGSCTTGLRGSVRRPVRRSCRPCAARRPPYAFRPHLWTARPLWTAIRSPPSALVAQRIEQRVSTPPVGSSSLSGGTTTHHRGRGRPPQARPTPTAWMATPARLPTTVPLIRMNCRSRPTAASMRVDASRGSQPATVRWISETTVSP